MDIWKGEIYGFGAGELIERKAQSQYDERREIQFCFNAIPLQFH